LLPGETVSLSPAWALFSYLNREGWG